jgi:hypothetical protein
VDIFVSVKQNIYAVWIKQRWGLFKKYKEKMNYSAIFSVKVNNTVAYIECLFPLARVCCPDQARQVGTMGGNHSY